MTVKVVSESPQRPKRSRCSKCTYTLEYIGVDVQVREDMDYAEGCDTRYFIECPNCKEHVLVGAWWNR